MLAEYNTMRSYWEIFLSWMADSLVLVFKWQLELYLQMELMKEGLPAYKHIERNDFVYRKHKKPKEEDIAICFCRYDANDPDSACGEQCLNVLTSTECKHGYCPCGDYCRNQKFQKCEYAMTKLFKTEGRGWGLLAAEDIKAGQFIIEYCGEVISCKEAKNRSQAYEAEGLTDAYIISLNAYESIDATRKGSFARFINHSCQPNCETRKWTVLGEVRVGIFAKQDITAGTELTYDYNFEWYGGAKVRCLCGASGCFEFLGAKSRGFQEEAYLWDDDDDRYAAAHLLRYSIENIPIYDSEDDAPASKFHKAVSSAGDAPITDTDNKNLLSDTSNVEPLLLSQSAPIIVEPLSFVIPMEMDDVKGGPTEESSIYSGNTRQNFAHKSATISRMQSNSVYQNHCIESTPLAKNSKKYSNGRSKRLSQKQVDAKLIAERLASKAAREEILTKEEIKNIASSELESLYDEIRPAIEERERDSQDSVPTDVAEKWIKASCQKMKSEFDLYSAIIKNLACAPRGNHQPMASQGENSGTGIKCLENGQP